MVSRAEEKELIAWAESQGATIETVTGAESIYEDGDICYRVTGLPECGNGLMPPIGFAERLREIRAKFNAEIEQVRASHANIPQGDGERLPVIVRYAHERKIRNFGVQYWTPAMIAAGIKGNTDHTSSVFVARLFEPMAEADRIAAAEALGFTSVAEMDEHAEWLATQQAADRRICQAVEASKTTGVIDLSWL